MLYRSTYITLLKRLSVVLILYSICRIIYFFFNPGWVNISVLEITGAFLKGIIFDINAVLYINLAFIFLSLLPFKFVYHTVYQIVLKVFFVITNLIPLFFNIADLEFTKFTGKRTDSSIFDIKEDITEQFGQMVLDFWYLTLIALIFLILLWKFYPKEKETKQKLSAIKIIVFFLIFDSLGFVGLRGSFKVKPLMPIAAFSRSPKISNLVLNTPFCILHTLGKKSLEKVNYFTNDELNKYLPLQFLKSDKKRADDNIMIFILESFSPEFIGHLNNSSCCTPFLDSIAREGISFTHCFSNGRTSQVAISSILAGIPQLMDEPVNTSYYQTNSFFSFPRYIEKYGYHSYFFHGGNNGTMGFDRFTQKLGFTYFGADEYPDMDDHDGSWGIYDRPYLKYCANKLSELQKPFFTALFTLSSHQPYVLPEYERSQYKNGNEVLNAVSYTDKALRDFFEIASKQEWFKNTLFIFVADHTHPPKGKGYSGYIYGHLIPLIFYHPGIHLECDTTRLVQQSDILPSVSDFLGIYPEDLPRFGTSVFTDYPERAPVFYNSQTYFLVEKNYYCKMAGEEFRFYLWDDTPADTIHNTLNINRLKAVKQYYNNSMISNSFVKR